MAKHRQKRKPLTAMDINTKVNEGTRFEMSDGHIPGLTLAFREGYTAPVWRLRYRYANKPRVMVLGSYRDLPLPKARDKAKDLRASVRLGTDVAHERQERIQATVTKIEAGVRTVSWLADEWMRRNETKLAKVTVDGKETKVKVPRWKHPEIIRARIEKDIRPHLGKLPVDAVKVSHIDDMLKAINDRNAPTTANDVLRLTRKIFDLAVSREWAARNPCATLTDSDAGGEEAGRDRALNRAELVAFFAAMRKTSGLSIQNEHTFKLLLLLGVRKSELCMAKIDEFDLDKAVWELPAGRTKTNVAIDIPLSKSAVRALRELVRLAKDSGGEYLLPARKAQSRMLPHIHENTLNVALSKVRKQMKDVAPFTIHDLRRTARTQLTALKVDRFIAERCLNHKIAGVEGRYDRHEYFEERREALDKLATFIDACEGKPHGR
jgi:integrase